MAEVAQSEAKKREGSPSHEASEAKKAKIERPEGLPYKKKKAAILMMFCGKDFYGMQRNPDVPTIEERLNEALVKAGVVTEEMVAEPAKLMQFQRATRTDKGVSAVGQVCSLKIFQDVDDALEKINSHLPETIRLLEILWTTKGFNCTKWADSRTYSYTMPTFAFTTHTEELKEDYRISEEKLKRVNEVFKLFEGTHNYHNYTSGRGPTDPSCARYIMSIGAEKPFIKEGIEFVEVKVHGQSFMLHQIRKMIGMTIALVQGLVDLEYMDLAWGPERVDVPKVPGVGLMLEEVHFKSYNKKFGSDRIHKPINFAKHKESIENFKHKFIYPGLLEAETKEKSMLLWLQSMREKSFQDLDELMMRARTKKDEFEAEKLKARSKTNMDDKNKDEEESEAVNSESDKSLQDAEKSQQDTDKSQQDSEKSQKDTEKTPQDSEISQQAPEKQGTET